MALIMLAIGGLLALAGVYAMATGFPVIEVERGWSMVISGAVLLSGGLVVMALGIVVRAINGLKTGLPVAAAPAQHDQPSLAPPVLAPRAPALSPDVVDEAVPAFAVAAPTAATALAAGADHAGLHEPAPPEPAVAEPLHEPAPELHAPVAPPIDHVSEDPAPADHPADIDHETPSRETADHAWHESDFSAFDLDAPHEATAPAPVAAPEPPPAPDPHAVEAHEAVLQKPAAPEPEPVAAPIPEPDPAVEAPATAPDTPPGNLNVIGRYDSDGTSYVMYSDGSIEAQSDSGVFRFSSMAELKAFIEG